MEMLLLFYGAMAVLGLYIFEGITIKNRRFVFVDTPAHIPSFVFAHFMLAIIIILTVVIL